MYRFIAIAVFLAAAVSAQITAPRIGMALDGKARVTPVFGVAGNLIRAGVIAFDVVSAASSDSAAFLKTNAELRVYDAAGKEIARARAPQGAALFAFSSAGAASYAWLCQTGELLRFTGTDLRPVRFPAHALQGEVIAIGAAAPAQLNFAVLRESAVEILSLRLSDGAVAATVPLPGAIGAPLLMDDGSVLYALSNALVRRDPSGVEHRTPFPHRLAALSS